MSAPESATPEPSRQSRSTNEAGESGFARRHIGPGNAEIETMLAACGYGSLDALTDAAVPETVRTKRPLSLPEARSEAKALEDLREIASQNVVRRSFIGAGYHDCIVPPVIQRNILENPGWYTQYTPYQAEIAQGRLEGLLTFQTMICDLTGMDVANASLLDEGTAVAEAMTMSLNSVRRRRSGENRHIFFILDDCHPQTVAVVQTRAAALGVNTACGSVADFHERLNGDGKSELFGIVAQYPGSAGAIGDIAPVFELAREHGVMTTAACDPLALVLLTPPGALGADIAVGSAQRFGVPMGFGGPHAAFFATREEHKRQMPGRIVGVSKDASGRPAYRLSLQTREQHIRRDKATSNICTAQALLANMAAMYAVYHGPEGLRAIAKRARFLATLFAAGLNRLEGCRADSGPFFDTVAFETARSGLSQSANERGMALRPLGGNRFSVTFDETSAERDVVALWELLDSAERGLSADEVRAEAGTAIVAAWGGGVERSDEILTHEVFQRHRSETEMLRYLRRLEAKDLSLTTSMIPLGSCTMKLNASAEMFPVSWPEFAALHPFAEAADTRGYRALFADLEAWLCEITGFHSCSLQPNAGSQGEFAGLLAIAGYHASRGDAGRKVCLIPMSAHGTNPASAVMAGMRVIPVACDDLGNIDVVDLRSKAKEHATDLAALMATYPSTHGVFEEGMREICDIVHEHGGQVYLDGANMNAQVGLCRPGEIGADVCHINLHKTFCIPHGGGGPGMGPICCTERLAPFLPGHPVVEQEGRGASGPVSAAPWGSPGILPISWMYIAMMGGDGLKRASQVAILNANYLARRLDPFFPVLYKGGNGLVAHECILDLRRFKTVTVEDVAKRLMDYGFHAPTISWPVAGSMMVEPTESESLAELDRFCEAMIRIHAEIEAVESGRIDAANNPLKNAPHTAETVAQTEWDHPYSRMDAAFPAPWLKEHKFWPAVERIDNVYGDRNLVCTCEGMEAFGESA